MELVDTQDMASIIAFTIRISEGELQVFADALSYLLNSLDDVCLYEVFNGNTSSNRDQNLFEEPAETREFIKDTLEELMTLIKENCRSEFLPERFRS